MFLILYTLQTSISEPIGYIGWLACSNVSPTSLPPQIPLEDRACNIPNTCHVRSRVLKTERYLYTCFECPINYPWLRDEFGVDL